MRLTEVHIHRLPGIPRGFSLTAKSGVNIILGPNGSGKSSLTRSVRSLFWSAVSAGVPSSIEARFEHDGIVWKAVREDNRKTRWWRAGQEVPAPDLPDDHIRHCYAMGVLDLLRPAGGKVETELAGLLNREMSGGVDLVGLANQLFPSKPRAAQAPSRQWREARTQLENVRGRQQRLALQEQDLAEMRRRRDEGIQARRELQWWQDKKRRDEVAAELERLEAELQGFPAGQARVRPDDHHRFLNLTQEIRDTDLRVTSLQVDRQALVKDLESRPWDTSLPSEMAELVEELTTAERDLTGNILALAQAQARLDEARRDLVDGDAIDPDFPTPTRETYSRLAQIFAKVLEKRGLRDGLRHLEDLEVGDEAQDMKLKSGLVHWQYLASHPPARAPSFPWGRFLCSAFLVSFGLLFPFAQTPPWGPWLLGLVGLATGLLELEKWRRLRSESRDLAKDRRGAVDALRHLGHDVATDLSPLEAERMLADALGTLGARQQLQPLLQRIRRKSQSLDRETAELAQELAKFRAEEGLGLDLESPDLLNLFNALPRFRAARDEAAALAASVRIGTEAQGTLLDRMKTRLAAFSGTAPTGLAEARAALQRVREEEVRQRDQAAKLTEMDRDRHNLLTTRTRLEDDLQAIATRLDREISDEALALLVRSLPAWQEKRNEVAGRQGLLDELNGSLAEAPALSSTEIDDLDTHLAQLEALAAQADDLSRAIAVVEDRIRIARANQTAAEAATAEAAARESLRSVREDMRDAALGNLLLADVEQSHQRTSRPRVLEEARRIFLEFTAGRYDLRVIAGDQRQGLFVAHDLQAAVNLGLAEISDGTRAQLLLAVRLAFITENEGRMRPPLFLDESLSASDPERFAAIARNVTLWAEKQERQVFYLTNQPGDAAAWQAAQTDGGPPAANIIDLARQRQLACAPMRPLQVESAPSFPEPGQMSGAQYAHALDVPALDPWAPAEAAHMWYLCFDEPDLLHRLLLAAAPTFGRYTARRNHLGVLAAAPTAELDRLDAYGSALGAFLQAWRIGRHRPLLGHDLVRSELISQAFMDRCLDLLDSVQGDAEAFLAELLEKKVKRFKSETIEALEAFFLAEGYLDTRPTLDPEELVARVQSRVIGEIRDHVLGPQKARHLVATWQGALEVD